MKTEKAIKDDSKAFWVIVNKDRMIRPDEQSLMMLCRWSALTFVSHYQDNIVAIGEYEKKSVFLIDTENEQLEHTFPTVGLRGALMHGTPEQFSLFAKAWQYALFMRTHRYCGSCGNSMRQVDWEMATHCDRCGHRCYPRVSPCIIVAIYRDKELLLAMGTRHKNTGMYSTLAGFVESGESLEQAVHREVMEEVGVKVKNLEYFGSQPWPFPHSLMVGYIAEYAGGEITPDETEICDANWYHIDELPLVPPTLSIAGQLIETAVARLKAA